MNVKLIRRYLYSELQKKKWFRVICWLNEHIELKIVHSRLQMV